MKKCSKCGQEKPLTEFHKDRGYKDGLHGHCKPCVLIRVAKYKADNPEKVKASQKRSRDKNPETYRNKQLLFAFGITIDQYKQMLADQGGVCAICQKPETEIHPANGKLRNLAVDHDHDTGHVRGLLCNNCNRGLGFFADQADLVKAAWQYLERQSPPDEPGG